MCKALRVNKEEFLEKIMEYEQKDEATQEFAYRVCREHVELAYSLYEKTRNKEKTVNMLTDAVWTFLFVWNQPFYKGKIYFSDLKEKILENLEILYEFKELELENITIEELIKQEKDIKRLFKDFLKATRVHKSTKGKQKRDVYSSVSAAKALHLLAPSFFPLWDEKIAKEYKFDYSEKDPADEYFKFCIAIKRITDQVKDVDGLNHLKTEKGLVKLIDEYNVVVCNWEKKKDSQ
ncbi:hypothetical protein [Thermococcus sp.]|uniref:hypothetical protein n=1 Tax=Thermococcus sp. TaxID=35749 RepID=UPI0026168E29|nr:hypothetical protein [Thermococcus sp.]MCD6143903.1 hypothetical protein [Thermococcus sp.]